MLKTTWYILLVEKHDETFRKSGPVWNHINIIMSRDDALFSFVTEGIAWSLVPITKYAQRKTSMK
jgi:hypothetical protein